MNFGARVLDLALALFERLVRSEAEPPPRSRPPPPRPAPVLPAAARGHVIVLLDGARRPQLWRCSRCGAAGSHSDLGNTICTEQGHER